MSTGLTVAVRGPAGSGKTTLAWEIARALAERGLLVTFQDDARSVSLLVCDGLPKPDALPVTVTTEETP